MKSAYGKIVEAFGAFPEVLIYNAGPGMKYPPPPLLETKVEDFARSFDAGVVGALSWLQQVVCSSTTLKFQLLRSGLNGKRLLRKCVCSNQPGSSLNAMD